MNEEPYKPRFSFEVTEAQKERADKLLYMYGIRKIVFQVILDDLLDLVEEHGQVVLGVLLSKSAQPSEILPTMAEAKRKGEA